ncbi:Lactosylceramide 4-alpha-galactosyltransferase [Chamberlinius hualienensis]
MPTKLRFISLLSYGVAVIVFVSIVQFIETDYMVPTPNKRNPAASIKLEDALTTTEDVPHVIKLEPIVSLDSLQFEPGQPIHLVETKVGKRHITPREACVIESAARHHPHSIVTFYTVNSYFNWNDPYRIILETFFNIRITPLNLTELFSDTPLLQWHQNNTINTSKFPTEHMSDAFRFAILHKYGGIYLDTDSVVVNTLQYLKNTVALEVDDVLAIGVLIFDKGHSFITNCVYDYAMKFRGKSWSDNGPMLATRVLRQMCNVNSSFKSVMSKPELCQDVNILERNAFYSISWDNLFRAKRPFELDFTEIHVVHLWSKLTRTKEAKIGVSSIIENLFKVACPTVYQHILKTRHL